MASQCVGIDLHRRRSVIVREDADGQMLEQVRIDIDPVALALAVGRAVPTQRSSSRRRTADTGPSTCSRPSARPSTWLTRWG